VSSLSITELTEDSCQGGKDVCEVNNLSEGLSASAEAWTPLAESHVGQSHGHQNAGVLRGSSRWRKHSVPAGFCMNDS
jgi:hypothetical protein